MNSPFGKTLTGWATTGELVTGAGVEGSKKPIHLQANLEHPQSLTVQFSVLVSPSTTQSNPNTRATIVSTVNGNSVQRIISVYDGMSITLRGQSIDVNVRDFTVASVSTGRQYTVGCLATLGVRASWKQPPILTPLTFGTAPTGPFATPIVAAIPVPVASSRFLQIPQDAGINSVNVTVSNTAGVIIPDDNVWVAMENSPGFAIQRIYDPRDYDWVPIAPNSDIIELRNIGTNGEQALFTVTFGIDG